MPLNQSEIIDMLRRGAITCFFDTNTIFGNSKRDPFVEFSDQIHRLEAHKMKINLVISAPVYLEKLQDLKQRFPSNFDLLKIKNFMSSKGINVLPFTTEHAEHVSSLISQQFTTPENWHTFKRNRCLQCLGLPIEFPQAQGHGKGCGATIDWLVAGHADAEQWLLITNDDGPEFKSIKQRTRLETLIAAVNEILQE